jgi:DHA2 family methylenomycin A resistance protein-like MFS transporter
VLFLVRFLLDQRGRQSGFVGATLLAMTGAMVVGSPIGGRLSDAFGPRVTALLGAIVATSGAVTFVLVGAESGSLVPSMLMLGAGIGLATSPSQAAALSAIPGSRAGIAAGRRLPSAALAVSHRPHPLGAGRDVPGRAETATLVDSPRASRQNGARF